MEEDFLLEGLDGGVVHELPSLDFVLAGSAFEVGLLGFEGGEFLGGGCSGGGGVGPEALGQLPVFGHVVDLFVLGEDFGFEVTDACVFDGFLADCRFGVVGELEAGGGEVSLKSPALAFES